MSNSTSEVRHSPNGFLPPCNINPELSAQSIDFKFDQKNNEDLRILNWVHFDIDQAWDQINSKRCKQNLAQTSTPETGMQQNKWTLAYHSMSITDKTAIGRFEENIFSEIGSSAVIVFFHPEDQRTIEKAPLASSFDNTSGMKTNKSAPSYYIPVTKQGTNSWVQDLDVDHQDGLRRKINDFRSFGSNWDGDGAKEIPRSAIDAALKFLDILVQRVNLPEPQNVSPSPDGEIVICWKNPLVYAELNFKDYNSVILCWKEGFSDVELIEEDVEIALNSEQIDQSFVWKKLKNLLHRGI